MILPSSPPSGTIQGRWNLARSLMQRDPSERNIRLVIAALQGAPLAELIDRQRDDQDGDE